MGKEEQDEEREVLASIFPDEYTEISPSHFTILVPLDNLPSHTTTTTTTFSNPDSTSPPPAILATIQLPDTYPSAAPLITLTHPPSSPRPPHLLLPDDAPTLLAALSTPIEESLETAMIFTLISTLKDSAEALITSRLEAVQEEKERGAREEEAKENAKFEGEKVTRERFLAWREGFRGEMERGREEEEKMEEGKLRKKAGPHPVEEEKMTGRMLWEKGLVGRVEEDEEGEGVGVDGISKEIEGVRVGD